MTDAENTLPVEIDCQQVKTMLDEKQPFLLLDCREQQEYTTAKIDGSKLIPMSEIQNRLAEIQPHQQSHIVVHCHLGGRSLQVTQWLRDNGYPKVQNMTGGIDAWSQQIDSTVPRY